MKQSNAFEEALRREKISGVEQTSAHDLGGGVTSTAQRESIGCEATETTGGGGACHGLTTIGKGKYFPRKVFAVVRG